MSGYTHGMMTLRIPQDIAQSVHRTAHELKIDPTKLMLRVLGALGDNRDFAEIWVDEEDCDDR